MKIRNMIPTDAESVLQIYQQGVETHNATFQTHIPSWEEWDKTHSPKCRLVAVLNDRVLGWVAISPVSKREVYQGVAEVSIYVEEHFRKKGIGKLLLKSLIAESEKEGFWTLQSSVFPENIGSLKIHEDLHFRRVGFREKIAKLEGSWRNTVLLERRRK